MTQNLFSSTYKSIPKSITMKALAQRTKRFINHHIFRGIVLTASEVASLFHRVHLTVVEQGDPIRPLHWFQNEKKAYHCFLLGFCSVNSKKVIEINQNEWDQISGLFHGKSLLLLHYEAKIVQKSEERVRWACDEEKLLRKCISNTSSIKWTEISKFIFHKSEGAFFKTPKQCRQHWNNHLNIDICHAGWSTQEDILILNFVADKGRKWAKLAPLLRGKRTQHMIKNRYHSMMTGAKKILRNQQKQYKNEVEVRDFLKQLNLSKLAELGIRQQHQQPMNFTGVKREEVQEGVLESQDSYESQGLLEEKGEIDEIKIEARQDASIRIFVQQPSSIRPGQQVKVEEGDNQRRQDVVFPQIDEVCRIPMMNGTFPMMAGGFPGYFPVPWGYTAPGYPGLYPFQKSQSNSQPFYL